MMNISKTFALACGLMAAWISATGLAEENDPAGGKPTSVTVGKPFSVKLGAKVDCSMVKSPDQISLLVNGMETGLHPLGCDPASDALSFTFKKEDVTATTTTNAAWEAILGRPWDTVQSDFQRELRYSVTQPADSSSPALLSSGRIRLLMASPGIGWIGVVLVAALWLALLYLGRYSGMLRDDRQCPTLQQRTYSLGRVQMAWWFGIIMGSYVFLWMMLQDIPALGSQALLLMGISGATGLTAAGLNAGRQEQIPCGNGKFFDDLLTDAYGVVLHRFQMLAVTVILGVMFIIHVATTLTMPEFDGSLLTLMGIAGGTYVGFKIPEKHVDETNQSGADMTTEDHKAGYTPEPEPAGGK